VIADTRSRGARTASQPARFFSEERFDRPLAESDHFCCVASLGSILPGWVLITPKRPMINLATLTESEGADITRFLAKIRAALEPRFGATCLFEHGATAFGSTTGCGVDHAHLHVVPIPPERFEAALSKLHDWQPTIAMLPHELNETAVDYLWYSAAGNSKVALPSQPVSQFFRRVVANAAGCPEQWDYHAHPFTENMKATQATLMAAFYPSEKRAG